MAYKIVGALIIVAALAVAGLVFTDGDAGNWLGKKSAPCVQQTPAQQLAHLIESDFRQLAHDKELPAQWFSIEKVETRMNSSLANALLGSHRPLFAHSEKGANLLELEIVDLPDEENPGIIIQASLFDTKSKNKIFEIGRTYTMKQLNKVSATTGTETKKKE